MHRIGLVLLLPFTFSCAGDKNPEETGPANHSTDTSERTDTDEGSDVDLDEDGFVASEDCDDTNPNVHPAADELCDSIDNNCNDEIDEDSAIDAPIWYLDVDADGYGDETAFITQCEAPSGYVAENKAGFDCDDTDPTYNPGADEDDCTDPNDYNCDGSVAYEDADADTWPACQDCNDSDPNIHPEANEVCDEIDNDCNDSIDDADDGLDETTATLWYEDNDDDGYGNENATHLSCEAPTGYVAESAEGFDCNDDDDDFHPGADEDDCTDSNDYNCDGSVAYEDADGDGWPACEDCNDANADIHPDAIEVCNKLDDDCDDDIDDDDSGVTDTTTWYIDHDEDGFGSTDYTMDRCDEPTGYTTDAFDCNDNEASVNPDADEICNEIDDNCDGDIDDDDPDITGTATWYLDIDGDGYGTDTFTLDACEAPSGLVDNNTDCDDNDIDIHPDADEVCDEIDNDCDDDIDDADDDVSGLSTWYIDHDGDGFGSEDYTLDACDAPSGWTDTRSDCDDNDASVNPDAIEICDETDNDCDGDIDDDDSSLTDPSIWYADGDGDGFGDEDSTLLACDGPSGWVNIGTDCDDDNSDTNPGASEICDTFDNDCDGDIDNDDPSLDTSTGFTWYADEDGDGFGNSTLSQESCNTVDGYVSNDTDCDDEDGDVNPDASEICDEIDNDCDGDIDDGDTSLDTSTGSTWYADKDEDGFGSSTSTTQSCIASSGYVTDATDCDDLNPDIHPDANEICDDTDNDCDGFIDDDDASLDSSTGATWYADTDEDGYGDVDTAALSCDGVSGYVLDATDCNDADATISPIADEVCDDIDNDCDGDIDGDDSDLDSASYVTLYADLDSDGYGDPANSISTCSDVSGYVSDDTDCNDSNASINPGEEEVCDGEDNDCDGSVDSSGDILNIVVEGTSGDIEVCVTCAPGDYSCQAEQICNELTGETCLYQTYDCWTGGQGSWYPPSHGGSSNFNFAFTYNIGGSDYGNICDCIGVSSSYGIASNHQYCGTGLWYRQ